MSEEAFHPLALKPATAIRSFRIPLSNCKFTPKQIRVKAPEIMGTHEAHLDRSMLYYERDYVKGWVTLHTFGKETAKLWNLGYKDLPWDDARCTELLAGE